MVCVKLEQQTVPHSLHLSCPSSSAGVHVCVAGCGAVRNLIWMENSVIFLLSFYFSSLSVSFWFATQELLARKGIKAVNEWLRIKHASCGNSDALN